MRKHRWNTLIIVFVAGAFSAGHIFPQYRQALTTIVLLTFGMYAFALNEMFSRLHKLATRDELTGLLNRRAGEQALLVEISRAIRYGHLLAIVYLDFNNFKTVNDVLGHRHGDEILRKGTSKIVTNVRLGDFVVRHGGDEMYIICPDTNQEGASRLAEKLKSSVRLEPTHDGVPISVTLSAGVVSFDGREVQWNDIDTRTLLKTLLEQADAAMYKDKLAGRTGRPRQSSPT